MDTYDLIETDQYGIDIANLIWTIYQLQDFYKQYGMAAVETYKQVYMFYHAPYQSNAYYLESFKTHIKVSEPHNGAVGYYLGLAAIVLQEKHNITSDTAQKEHNIESNIKSR